jgi:uncharacterized protein (TIGR02588 family)
MAKDRRQNDARIPFWEWVCATIGFVLVAGTVAFLGNEALQGRNRPPDISIRTDEIVSLERGFLVRITAVNHGDRTAASVKVEGELRTDASTVETTEMTFQYVPGRSERKGGLFFVQDPRRLQLVVTPRGYEEP